MVESTSHADEGSGTGAKRSGRPVNRSKDIEGPLIGSSPATDGIPENSQPDNGRKTDRDSNGRSLIDLTPFVEGRTMSDLNDQILPNLHFLLHFKLSIPWVKLNANL